MNKLKEALVVMILASMWTGSALADKDNPKSRFLIGKYGMSFSQSCMLTPIGPPPAVGFDPESGALVAPGEFVTAVSSGVASFARDGVMKIENGVLTEIFAASTQVGDQPVNAGNKYSCEGRYQLNSKGYLQAELTCNIEAPQPGVSISITPFILEGYVSRANEFISLVATAGNIQTFEVAVQGQVVQQRQRICTQDVSMARLRHGYRRRK